MQRDPIERLLREADNAAESPVVPADLPRRVHALMRRRNRRDRIGAVCAATLVLTIVALAPHFSRFGAGHLPPETTADNSDAARQVASLQTELAQVRMQALAQLNRVHKRARVQQITASDRGDTAGITRPSAVDEQLERTAGLIVYEADRLSRELNMPKAAVNSYRRAIELFPDTQAARTARVRLSQIDGSKGSQS